MKYIVNSDGESLFIANKEFKRFWRVNEGIKEVRFQEDIGGIVESTRIKFFNYHNYSEKVKLALFGITYSKGSLCENSNVGNYPNILREYSCGLAVYPVYNTYSSSGLYDMTNKKYLFENLHFCDIGNLILENNEVSIMSSNLIELYTWFVSNKIAPIAIGGDHSITYYILDAYSSIIKKNLVVIIFDAHQDCRYSLKEEKMVNHANFIEALLKNEKIDCVIQVGVRGLRSINTVVENERLLQLDPENASELISNILSQMNCDVYISLDLDVLEPHIYPYVDYSIPEGMKPMNVRNIIKTIFDSGRIVMGADIVEGNCDSKKIGSSVVIELLAELMDNFNRL